jgi:hypothetical protein
MKITPAKAVKRYLLKIKLVLYQGGMVFTEAFEPIKSVDLLRRRIYLDDNRRCSVDYTASEFDSVDDVHRAFAGFSIARGFGSLASIVDWSMRNVR